MEITKIGIMSDTHDRLDAVEKAIDLFNREKVEHVLHAGDLVKAIAHKVGGGGGGKPTMAQAGGHDVSRMDEALGLVTELVRQALQG